MTARDHKDLRCWQLANEFRGEVHAICEIPAAARVKDHLEECQARKVLVADKLERLRDLAEHAKATTISFMKPHDERNRRQNASRGNRRRRPGHSC